MDKFSYIANAHTSYIDELYKQYKENPESVDYSWQKFFEGFDFSQGKYGENGKSKDYAPTAGGISSDNAAKEVRVSQLIHAYRSRAHLKSKTNPVRERRDRRALLDLEDFGLSNEDLNTVFLAGEELGIGASTLAKIVDTLKFIYEGTIGFEYT